METSITQEYTDLQAKRSDLIEQSEKVAAEISKVKSRMGKAVISGKESDPAELEKLESRAVALKNGIQVLDEEIAKVLPIYKEEKRARKAAYIEDLSLKADTLIIEAAQDIERGFEKIIQIYQMKSDVWNLRTRDYPCPRAGY